MTSKKDDGIKKIGGKRTSYNLTSVRGGYKLRTTTTSFVDSYSTSAVKLKKQLPAGVKMATPVGGGAVKAVKETPKKDTKKATPKNGAKSTTSAKKDTKKATAPASKPKKGKTPAQEYHDRYEKAYFKQLKKRK